MNNIITIKHFEKIRTDHKLKNQDFAKRIKISPSAYSKIKKGIQPITLEMAINLKKEFTIDYNKAIDDNQDRLLEKVEKINNNVETILEAIKNSNALNSVNNSIEKLYRHYKFSKDYGNRFNIILYKALQNIEVFPNVKNPNKHLIGKVNSVNDGSPFLKSVKKRIVTAIKNIATDDCRILLQEKQLFMELIYYKFDKEALRMIENKSNDDFFNFYYNSLRKILKINIQFTH